MNTRVRRSRPHFQRKINQQLTYCMHGGIVSIICSDHSSTRRYIMAIIVASLWAALGLVIILVFSVVNKYYFSLPPPPVSENWNEQQFKWGERICVSREILPQRDNIIKEYTKWIQNESSCLYCQQMNKSTINRDAASFACYIIQQTLLSTSSVINQLPIGAPMW